MKLRKLLSCLLVVMMIFATVSFPVSAEEPAARTITLNPEKDEVATKEEFTIEVKISGVDAVGARWTLDYDETYFDFVSADFKTATNQKPDDKLSPEIMSVTGVLEDVAAVYTFQAKSLQTEGGAEEDFTLSNVDIRTVEDVWLGTDVSEYITANDTRVAITLRSIEGVEVLFDDEEILDEYDYDYDAQEHTVSVSATTPDVEITYTCDGVTQSEPFVFEDAGEYTVEYNITKDGYQPVTETVVITINKAKFTNVVEMFDTTVVNGGAYTYGFDGEDHTFSISSVDSVGNPQITYTYEVNDVAEATPTMNGAKEYVIDYTISAENHEDYVGKTTITITKAEITDIAIWFDGTDITDELTSNNNIYEVTYDGDDHQAYIESVTLVGNGDYNCDYSYSYEGGAFTEYGPGPVIKDAGDYVIKYTITADNHETEEGEFTITVNTADFSSIPVNFGTADITAELEDDDAYTFNYDGNPYEFSVGPVTTVDGTVATVTYSYKYNDGQEVSGAPVIEAAGTYVITYTVEADNHTTVERTITITVDAPDYEVEVKFGAFSDYSSGKKLILVYTKAKDVSFTYAGEQMLDVTDKPNKYKYKGTEDYDYVYAWIGNAFPETGTTEDEKLAPYKALVNVDYTNIPADDIDYTIPYDINGVKELDGSDVGWNDIMAGYSTVEGNAYTFANQIKGAIKTDIDGDRVPTTSDLIPVLETVYPNK